jgi:hypothetical protein
MPSGINGIYKMIKLKDLVNIKLLTEIAWVDKTIEQVKRFNIPISVPIMKKIIGGIPVSAFHMTELDYVVNNQVKKVIGKKKSLSTFTAITSHSAMAMGNGIQTSGGILFHLEGNMLVSSNQDIGSGVDESGRRWLGLETFSGLLKRIGGKLDLRNYISKNKTWSSLHDKVLSLNHVQDDGSMGEMTGAEKQQYIKIYIDEITKLLIASKDEITKKLGTKQMNTGKFSWFEWNETLVSNIKIKDVLVIQDNRDVLLWMDYGALVNGKRIQLTKKDINKHLKKLASGKIIWGGARDIPKFVKDRGGVIEQQ